MEYSTRSHLPCIKHKKAPLISPTDSFSHKGRSTTNSLIYSTTPRQGWRIFFCRLLAANSLVAVWIYFASGPLTDWLSHSVSWRASHLAFILIIAGLIYIAALWIAGIRPQHVLFPEQQLASTYE